MDKKTLGDRHEFLPAKRFDTILLAFKFLGITFSLLMLYVIFTDKTHSLLAWIFVCYSVGGVIFINFSSAVPRQGQLDSLE